MNDKLNLIFSRHSIRQYSDAPVSSADIQSLLEAAMSAPSARRCDPWRFVVIQSATRRQEVANILEHGKFIANAPLGILICGSKEEACGGELSYLLQDCGAAIENLLLAANALGLGACWLGVHPRPERMEPLRDLFKLPDGILPISIIAIGHPTEIKTASTRFDSSKAFSENYGDAYGA